jgi:PAS domain S-box-containing protein
MGIGHKPKEYSATDSPPPNRLNSNSDLLRRIESLGNIGHWELDLTTGQSTWSEQMYRILGLHPNRTIPPIDLALELIHPDDRKQVDDAMQKALESGDLLKIENRVVLPDGSIRHLISEGMVDRNSAGLAIRLFGISRDISQEKQKEENLQKSNLYLENIFNTTQDLIFLADEDGAFLKVSKSCEKILGYSQSELKGKSFRDLVHPDDFEATVESRKKIMSGDSSSDFQNRYFKKDGSVVYLNWSATLDETSKTVFAVARDITQLVRTEAALKADRQKLSIVLDASPETIWALDRDYRLVTANTEFLRAMKDVFNWVVSPGDNLVFGIDLPAEFIQEWKVWYDRALAGETFSIVRKVTIMEKGGYMEVSFKPIFEAGEVVAICCYSMDITHRKTYEESLKKLNAELAESNRGLEISNKELEQFAYVASHDLQEPLRMITSFLGLIKLKYSHVLDEKGLQYIHYSVDGAKRMRDIILDLLEFSRIGTQPESKQVANTADLIQEVLLLNKKLIRDKNAIIHIGPLPNINCHSSTIVQLFQNLINNGLKYQAGESSPEIWIEGKESETEWEFSVRDNGIGIESEFIEKIFVIFQRLHHKEQYSGSGIGLAICKKIVEFHGGRIWVNSVPGQGSTFCFTVKK